MSVWMELRCEKRGTECWSHSNSGPMQAASDNQASVAKTYRDLAEEAKAMKWVKTKAGWVCPACVERGE